MKFRQNKNQSKYKFISYLWLLGWPGIRCSCSADVITEWEDALNAVFSKKTVRFFKRTIF